MAGSSSQLGAWMGAQYLKPGMGGAEGAVSAAYASSRAAWRLLQQAVVRQGSIDWVERAGRGAYSASW